MSLERLGNTSFTLAFEVLSEPEREPIADGTFTIGGAVYTDIESPMMSGVEHVTILVSPISEAVGGSPAADPGQDESKPDAATADDVDRVFKTTTAGNMGIWQIDGIPEGTYSVRALLPGTTLQPVTHRQPRGESAVRIVVHANRPAANQSIQFLASD